MSLAKQVVEHFGNCHNTILKVWLEHSLDSTRRHCAQILEIAQCLDFGKALLLQVFGAAADYEK